MHRISGYVYQDDLFLGSLTVLEHLNFMVWYGMAWAMHVDLYVS